MSTRKIFGRPPWMRELRAQHGLDPDGSETILHRQTRLARESAETAAVEIVDVIDDALAATVDAAARAKTNGPGGAA